MKKYFNLFLITLVLLAPLAFAHALAPTPSTDTCGIGVNDKIASAFKIQLCDPATLIVDIIEYLFALIGLVATLFIVIGGFRWTVAQGNEDAVKGARRTVTNAVIGLVIAVLAYTIIGLLVNTIGQGTSTNTTQPVGTSTTTGVGTTACNTGGLSITIMDNGVPVTSSSNVNIGDSITIDAYPVNNISSCNPAPTYKVEYAGPKTSGTSVFCDQQTLSTACNFPVLSSDFQTGGVQNALQVYLEDGSTAPNLVKTITFNVP